MRTTIDLDDPLFRELKQEAAKRGTTLRDLTNQLLRQALAGPVRGSKYQFKWKVDRGGSVMPGVRLDSRESLFDAMEDR